MLFCMSTNMRQFHVLYLISLSEKNIMHIPAAFMLNSVIDNVSIAIEKKGKQ